MLLGLGLSVPASELLDGYARYGLLARPGSLPDQRLAVAATVRQRVRRAAQQRPC